MGGGVERGRSTILETKMWFPCNRQKGFAKMLKTLRQFLSRGGTKFTICSRCHPLVCYEDDAQKIALKQQEDRFLPDYLFRYSVQMGPSC